MNVAEGQKARVFELKVNNHRKNTMDANLSTYEGKDKNDNSRYSSWNTHFVGKAFDKAKELENKTQIILKNAKVESEYNKEQKRLYVNLTVFDFDIADEK